MIGHAKDWSKRELDPGTLDSLSVYKLLAGCIVPRPIGFITTIGTDGVFNAAPFSFFNMVSHLPPLVSVSIAYDKASGGQKDTLANIMATGEFVANVVSEEIVAAVDRCSESYHAGVDEIAISGLTAVPSKIVKAPCIGESPASFECVKVGQVSLPDSIHTLVIGRIVRFHIREDIMRPNFKIDQSKLAAVGRMAGSVYCHTDDMFTLGHDDFASISGTTAAAATPHAAAQASRKGHSASHSQPSKGRRDAP
jgi:flavin reductase (DIM6/NTAB) family NADH-FMN oxidoreductase RutF